MSLHRITAGSGYDYLTRQVAAMDSTERGHSGLASYYTEKGETPGRWVGSGLVGIDGLDVGDLVTAEQMQSLFGSGHHPLATERARAAASRPGATEQDVRDAVRLGQPFRVYPHDVSPYRLEVARRLQQLNLDREQPGDVAVDAESRARIRTEVGLEYFRADYGRAPLNSRELAGHIARLSRQQTTAVAGFDLTFSPVKSVSALWAVAEPALAAAIERAHHAAVADALSFIEQHALFTRTGTNGVRQVDVRGLIGTAFTHRDSRAGDPDLHTHVAVANKVQTAADGRWLSIDGRVLYKAITAASETYNTSLENHLAPLGLRFEARPDPRPDKRPIREIVGVNPTLMSRWSQRRQRITHRQAELAADFTHRHGRPPTPTEAIALAQQATLETREAKHEPRRLIDQRSFWHAQAVTALGGDEVLQRMIQAALHPPAVAPPLPDPDWFVAASSAVLARVEQDRSVWQEWHIRAEALRHTRAAGVPPPASAAVVEWLIRDVLGRCSVPLSQPDPITEPDALRRADGSSVYTVAGARLYTSRRILDAEARLVAAAGRQDGRTVAATAVDLALLETHANGLHLNPGQTLLVREMATSGARVQLAIAPAGSGKTTAMQALARAWTNDGGTVLGLAPSAVAAAGLGEQIHHHADTLAKLAWHLRHGDPPNWLNRIDQRTLVIIDEAGMADTISLDTVTTHLLARGASIRLIGDDQQLAAIGAGGVLRDIHAQYGALRLSELIRFTTPAEGAASLALRDGRPEALGFYLDNHRVHIGTSTTMADDLFTAWATDRAAGRDSIMLAPTRELVADLNQRARLHRLGDALPANVVELADGNPASVGDTVLTRRNDRALRVTGTDWVKNGDRWIVTAITEQGITVRHTQHRRSVTLPPDYVAEWTELGYACTTHTAQGVTADTCHGLLTGDESRQQAYTMLTRGRLTNTSYLIVVGDGEPHTAIRPETLLPDTPTEILERILDRDESPISATTSLLRATDPHVRLGEATTRYRDAIVFAADHTATSVAKQQLLDRVNQLSPGLTDADAWPALRAQLLTLRADNRDPIAALTRAAAEPVTAGRDPAAILAWRLDDTQPAATSGPLPWLPAVPRRIADHPLWGPYLAARAHLVTDLAEQIRSAPAGRTAPAWAPNGSTPASLLADLAVWRAANSVPDTDTRPTGEAQPRAAARRWQHRLDARVYTTHHAAMDEWGPLLSSLDPAIAHDAYLQTLASNLAHLSAADLPARQLLLEAAGRGTLPDDHAAAALWWRIAGRLSPTAVQLAGDPQLTTNWQPQLEHLLGAERAADLEQSPWWPALVATIERGLQRGWSVTRLLEATPTGHDQSLDACQALTWHLSLLTDPLPPDADVPDDTDRPDDLSAGWTPNLHSVDMTVAPPSASTLPFENLDHLDDSEEDPDAVTEQMLALEALIRTHAQPPAPSAAQIRHWQDRADAWRTSPCTPERMAQLNELATRFYEARLAGSWAQPYLESRFHTDLTGDRHIRPGYAPDSWTALVDQLHRHGATDEELIATGLATTTSTGRIIDRFRDRVLFPITHDGAVIGFVGRRNPRFTDEKHGPKYLNTPQTPAFVKGDQLYIPQPVEGAMPVLVEGPMDAIAIGLATGGTHVGVAPLGTSLTHAQAAQLSGLSTTPIVAMDGDAAGRAAAERAYWLLAAQGLDPIGVRLQEGADPADLVASGRASRLRDSLTESVPLADVLLDSWQRADPRHHIAHAIQVVAARPPSEWARAAARIADELGLPNAAVHAALAPLTKAWNENPLAAVEAALRTVHPSPLTSIQLGGLAPPRLQAPLGPHQGRRAEPGGAPHRKAVRADSPPRHGM
jgi:DNA primase catalytic core